MLGYLVLSSEPDAKIHPDGQQGNHRATTTSD